MTGAGDSGAAEAWTFFWRQSGIAGCLPFTDAHISSALNEHWRSFARHLQPGSRLIDLGCGAGSVAHTLAAANQRITITGVDFAQVPPNASAAVSLCSGVQMEELPFPDGSFDGAVSQFGIEYSDLRRAAPEVARVLAAGSWITFIVHHAGSPVIAHNRRRREALTALMGDEVHSAFIPGNRHGLATVLGQLATSFPRQDVVAEFKNGLGHAVGMGLAERRQIWARLTSNVAQECTIIDALLTAAVGDINQWLVQFTAAFEFEGAQVIADREQAFAWKVQGRRI